MNVLKVYQAVVMVVKTVLDIFDALAQVVSLCHMKTTRHAQVSEKNHSLTHSNVHSSHHSVFPNPDMT